MCFVKLCLASASAGRQNTLAAAGVDFTVSVSDVDEDAIIASLPNASAQELVLALARAKAEDVGGPLTLGCDSMFEFDGAIVGKPYTPDVARERLRAMAGRAGTIHTGHWLIAPSMALGAVSSAVVHVADMSDAEIDAYIATGEPLGVAGGFTIDGYGGPFIEHIEGDHHGVTGLSLPLFRKLLAETGHSITELWRMPQEHGVE